MSGVDFTKEDVAAQAGVDPWQEATDFADEIDPVAMAEASRGFASAAGEAGGAADLASAASEAAADSATTDGVSHHNAEENVAITTRDLQGGGEDIEAVAEVINSGTRLALATEEDVVDLYERANDDFDGHLTSARAKLEEKQGEFRDNAGDLWGRVLDGGPLAPPSVTVAGTEYTADGSTAGGWSFPQAAVDAIRTHFLTLAAEDAEEVHGDIETEIDDYRAAMTRKAGELDDLGYDLGEGPHGLWHSEGMAEWAAEGLQEEMARDNPDPERMDLYTQGLGIVANGVYGDPSRPGDPLRSLTPAERDYLGTFYDALDADTLVALGHWEGDPGSAPDAGSAHVAAMERLGLGADAQQRVGNGISMLLNPDIGGLDPDAHPSMTGQRPMPESIRELVYGLEVGTGNAPGFDGPVGYDEDTGDYVVSGVHEFQGLSNLLGASTVPQGTDFAVDVGESALRVQEQFNVFAELYGTPSHSGGEDVAAVTTRDGETLYIDGDQLRDLRSLDTGASGALDVVSRDLDASQRLLLDDENLTQLMGTDWGGHASGAVSVLDTATERGQETAEHAERAARIAENALTTVGEDPSTWRSLVPKGSEMSDALVGVAADYIDAFAVGIDQEGVPAGEARRGEDGLYTAGFVLDGRETNGSGMGFLDFVGTGYETGDVTAFVQDPDFLELHLAAQDFSSGALAAALEDGDDFAIASEEQRLGLLYGNLGYAETASAINFAQNEYEAQAAAQARREAITGSISTLALGHPAGRIIDGATAGLSNEEAREFLRATLNDAASKGEESVMSVVNERFADGAPDESLVPESHEVWVNEFMVGGRENVSYTVVEQLAAAGEVTRDTTPSLFDAEGRLRPREDVVGTVGINDFTTAYDLHGRSDAFDYTRDFVDAVQTYTPSGPGEVDAELVNRVTYGDHFTDQRTSAVASAEGQEWRN
ncbi:hypothetical protein [Streptomyces radicis]|uniref:hypothetical protein n=1 Tax=Streptomyces radicis TaxID=1750517 RepID=UPI001600B0CF|nr:hypothetical protein [Streptomyces radicis]